MIGIQTSFSNMAGISEPCVEMGSCGLVFNYTFHPIVYMQENGLHTIFQPIKPAACVEERFFNKHKHPNGLNVVEVDYNLPMHVPPPTMGRYYIVSAMVRTALPNRTDLMSPGEVVRDNKGFVIGCTSFIVNSVKV